MPPRRNSRSLRGSGVRRASSWTSGPFGLISAIAADSNNLFPTNQQAVDSGLTIVRTRGEFLAYLTTSGGAATEGFRWAFGMCVVTANAAGIGVTAVPNPIDDIGWDGWLVYETGQIATMFTGFGEASPTQSVRVRIDSKAMRKFKETDVLVGVLGVFEQGAGSIMAAHLSSRVLLKLS